MFYEHSSKKFSSLFSVKNSFSDSKYLRALKALGLKEAESFKSIEQNVDRILKVNSVVNDIGPEDSVIVDVPGKGDCWLIAFLSPLLGYIVSEADEGRVIDHVRKKLSETVKNDPEKFEDIFEGGNEGLMKWVEGVRKPKSWGGDDEFEVLARVTGLCIHVLNREAPNMEGVRHFLPICPEGINEEDFWASSIVMEYGFSHYRAVLPRR